MSNNILVLCGKSAVGKDTIAQHYAEHGYNFVKSITTRPMRDGESQGNPYHFCTKEEFMKFRDAGELVEYREYTTTVSGVEDVWYYGVHKDDIKDDKHYIVVLDLQGLGDFKKAYGDRVQSAYIEVDNKTRKQRAQVRGGFDIQEWNRRQKDDDIVFSAQKVQNLDTSVTNLYSLESAQQISDALELNLVFL